MKKIMFNDRYGLTAAVLQGRKTMTRRIVPAQYVPMIEDGLQGAALIEAQRHGDAYRENEIVAVAQSYKILANQSLHDGFIGDHIDYQIHFRRHKGWSNKMFVRANLMPHQIQITDINIERLQDITDEDCLKEGIKQTFSGSYCFEYTGKHGFGYTTFSDHPKKAFATLINRPGVGRKGLWEENPFVFAYSFKLIK